MNGEVYEYKNTAYLEYVKKVSPKTNESRSIIDAFFVGGLICTIGQFIRFLLNFTFGLYGDELAGTTSVILIFIGCFLTGLGVYDRIGHYAGGGSIVPITGFANSVCSPAMEFSSEGYVYGMAAKMFVVAGPIIVFGVSASVTVGLIYYIAGLFLA
ncbi:MAG: SpoVA/SpoVAEb family sporulation membrane protein [Clostridia bacterium]|nr:SpoVA/SpoVAEb family sporulation membrane protein [Clostridia bacterium]